MGRLMLRLNVAVGVVGVDSNRRDNSKSRGGLS